MLKCLFSLKPRKQIGQLAIVVPISLVLFVGGTLLWGYMQQIRGRGASGRIQTDLESLQQTIVSRVKELMMKPPGGGNCPNLTPFKDMTSPPDPMFPPPPPTLTINAATPPVAIPCGALNSGFLLTAAEALTLESLSIVISRIGAASGSGLYARIRVEVEATPKAFEGVIQKTSRLIQNFALRVASWSQFNVILVPGAVGFPFFETDNGGGSMQFNGKVISVDKTVRPLLPNYLSALPTSGTNPKVIFNQPFFIRAPQLLYTTATELDLEQLNRTFRKGIEVGTLSEAQTFALPFDMGTTGNAWKQSMDYFYQGASLPDLSYLSPPRTAIADDSNLATVFSNARRDPAKIPDPTRWPHDLDSTCTIPGTGVPYSFVFQNWDSDLEIDFSTVNLVTNTLSFCGMIAAKTLTITTSVAQPHALIGVFMVSKIHVKGPGEVIFYHPAENPAIAVNLPPGQTALNIYNQLQTLGLGIAQNFFIPMFKNPAAVPPALAHFLPRRADTYMTNCPGSGHPAGNHQVHSNNDSPDYAPLFSGPTNQIDNLVFTMEQTL